MCNTSSRFRTYLSNTYYLVICSCLIYLFVFELPALVGRRVLNDVPRTMSQPIGKYLGYLLTSNHNRKNCFFFLKELGFLTDFRKRKRVTAYKRRTNELVYFQVAIFCTDLVLYVDLPMHMFGTGYCV